MAGLGFWCEGGCWTHAEMALESLHLLTDERGLEHGNGCLLKRGIGTTVKVGTTRANTTR